MRSKRDTGRPPATRFRMVSGEGVAALAGLPHPADYTATTAFHDRLSPGGLVSALACATLYGEWYRAVAEGKRVPPGEPVADFAAFSADNGL